MCLVPGVSHVKKCDWLVKNMTDWWLEVDFGQLNDWRRLAVSMTGGDFASALLFVTVSPMHDRHCQWSYSSCSEYSFSCSCLNLCIICKQSYSCRLESAWIWLAAATQSHKYDWLRLNKIWLAAATWWRRLRGLHVLGGCSID